MRREQKDLRHGVFKMLLAVFAYLLYFKQNFNSLFADRFNLHGFRLIPSFCTAYSLPELTVFLPHYSGLLSHSLQFWQFLPSVLDISWSFSISVIDQLLIVELLSCA
jgi:hypothetical protein